jgi:hypothetical protein
MIQIELAEPEARIFGEILEGVLSDLRMEIADTDRMDFRESLKQRKSVIQRVLDQLAETKG